MLIHLSIQGHTNVKHSNLNGKDPDCKVCFVRREYSVIALFMRGRGLRHVTMQNMESTLVLPNPFQAVKLLAFIYGNCM